MGSSVPGHERRYYTSGFELRLMAAITGPHCRPGLDPGPSTAGAARRCLDRLDPGSVLRAVRGDKWGLLRSGSSECPGSALPSPNPDSGIGSRQRPLVLGGDASEGASPAPRAQSGARGARRRVPRTPACSLCAKHGARSDDRQRAANPVLCPKGEPTTVNDVRNGARICAEMVRPPDRGPVGHDVS